MGFRKSFVHLTIKRIIVLLFVCFAGQSFAIINPANDARSYTNRRYLKLPMNTPDNFSIEMEIQGVTRKVQLNRYSVQGSNYRVRSWKNGQYHDVHSANIETYRGYLQDDPESQIAATLGPDGLDARIIESNGRVWNVKPTRGQKRAARQTDIAHTIDIDIEGFSPGNCGVGMYTDDIYESPYPWDVFADTTTDSAQPVLVRGMESVEEAPLVAADSTGSCHLHRAEISFDCEVNFFNDYGSVAATEARVNQIFNYIDLVYAQEVLITYELVEIVVRQTPFYSEPRADGALLNEFRAEWNTNTPGTYQARDLTHLMIGSGKTWDADCGCIAGLAWVGVVCTSSAYGWSRDSDAIVAHEIGHNWGGGHCEDGSSCNILCSGCPVVTPNLQRTIERHRDSRNCLDIVPGGFATQVPPHITPDSVSISLNDLLVQETITFDVLANDYDANCDSITLFSFDKHSTQGGTIQRSIGTGQDGQDELIYTPPDDFAGHDMFSYIPVDSTGQSGLGIVTVDISFPDMVGYWPLDETSGDIAYDSTSYDNDGTCQGNGGLSFDTNSATGHFNNGLQFTADDQYVDINASDVPPPWTASMWVKRQSNTNSGSTLMRSSSYGLKLEQWPSTGKVGITKFGVSDHSFNYTAPLNTWVNLVFVGDETTTSLYVDGSFVQTISVGISAPMGTLSEDDDQSLRAVLDDIRVYSHALQLSDIQQLYQGGIASSPNPGMWERRVSPLTTLSWKGNPNAIAHDVYFGTDLTQLESATTDSPEYVGRQTDPAFAPAMVADTTYFWRIDQVLPADVILTGQVWRFNTSNPILSGLISYLPFENNILDYSGNLRGGTPYAEPEHVTGKVGNALDIDNDGQQYVSLDGEAISPPWTISVWAKRQSDTGSSAALFTGGGYSLRLEQWNNTNKVGLTHSYVADYTFNYSAPIGQWIHLVFTATESATSLYANGSYISTLSVASNLPLQQIGNTGSDMLDALVDETAAWDRVLTSSEIQTLYTMGTNGQAIISFNSAPAFINDPVLMTDALETFTYSDSLVSYAGDDDPEDELIFNKVDGPAWLSVAPGGQLSGTPGQDDVGQNEFTVRVSDGEGGQDVAAMHISVHDLYDGSWGLSDFAEFAAQWGNSDCGICAGADITGDTDVDIDDLAIHTERWLDGLSCTSGTVHVDSVTAGTAAGTAGRKRLAATVIVHDNCGNPVEGVTVTGTFTDVFTEQVSSVTDVEGVAFLVTNGQLSSPSFNFCVDDLAHPSMIYASEDNIDTCDNY